MGLTLVFAGILTLFLLVGNALAQGGGTGDLPACPGAEAVGPGTPWPGPDDVEIQYVRDCGHCLTGAEGGATQVPVQKQLHWSCPTSMRVEYSSASPEAIDIPYRTYQAGGVYGVRFTLRDGALVERTPSEVWLMSYDQGSDFAHTLLWSQLNPSVWWEAFSANPRDQVCVIADEYTGVIPGDVVGYCGKDYPNAGGAWTGSNIPGPVYPSPDKPLQMTFQASGEDIWIDDLQFLYYGEPVTCPSAEVLPTSTPEGITATPSQDYIRSCVGTSKVRMQPGAGIYERAVDGYMQEGAAFWRYGSIRQIEAVVFDFEYMGATGVSLTWAGSDEFSFIPLSRVGESLSPGFYCIGQYEACLAQQPNAPWRHIEGGPWNLGEELPVTEWDDFYLRMGYTNTSGEEQLAYLGASYYIFKGSQSQWTFPCLTGGEDGGDDGWDGQETQTPEPTPVADEYYLGECAQVTVPHDSQYQELHWWDGDGQGLFMGWVLHVWGNYYVVENHTVWAEYESRGFGRNLTDGVYHFGPAEYWECHVNQGYDPAPFGQTKEQVCADLMPELGVSSYSVDWGRYMSYYKTLYSGVNRVQLFKMNGGANQLSPAYVQMCPILHGQPPNDELTPTPTPSPTPTPTRWPTPTPIPTQDIPAQCDVILWADDEPILDLGDNWTEGIVSNSTCDPITFIPGLHLDVGGILGLDDAVIDIPEYGLCVFWVKFPTLSLLGLQIPIGLFLITALPWLYKRVMQL